MKNKFIKVFFSIFSVSIVTWFSNYLYESLKIYNIYDNIFKVFPLFINSTVDRAIANSVTNNYSTKYAVFLLFMSALAIIYYLYELFTSFKNKKLHIIKSTFLIIAIFSQIIGIFIFGINATIAPKVNAMRYNLEIIEPYVSKHQANLLHSDYYQLSTDKEFSKLEKQINKIAEKNHLSLR